MSKRLEIELDMDLDDEQVARGNALIRQGVPAHLAWEQIGEGALRGRSYAMTWFVQNATLVDY